MNKLTFYFQDKDPSFPEHLYQIHKSLNVVNCLKCIYPRVKRLQKELKKDIDNFQDPINSTYQKSTLKNIEELKKLAESIKDKYKFDIVYMSEEEYKLRNLKGRDNLIKEIITYYDEVLGNMITFVDVRSSKIAGSKFAFWDTVIDKFVEVSQMQGWDNWNEFENDFNCDRSQYDDIERFKKLCPDWVFDS